MRIISGKHKGRKLTAPKNLPVRPTTDMAKEALFNILNNRYYFPDLVVLDLFSGTGNIAYEFGSRGVPTIHCVDNHAQCARYIQETATILELGITAYKNDVFAYLDKTTNRYDIIFADPPYEMDENLFNQLVNTVFEKGLLNEHGTLIVEHSKRTDLSNHSYFQEIRSYGGCAFSFFEREP